MCNVLSVNSTLIFKKINKSQGYICLLQPFQILSLLSFQQQDALYCSYGVGTTPSHQPASVDCLVQILILQHSSFKLFTYLTSFFIKKKMWSVVRAVSQSHQVVGSKQPLRRFAGGRLASVFPFPRPHSCGSLRHWVCPFKKVCSSPAALRIKQKRKRPSIGKIKH